MKNKEQLEKKIKWLENRIDQLEVRYEKSKRTTLYREIQLCDEKIALLNWVLGNEEL
jgi:hypothetical protein